VKSIQFKIQDLKEKLKNIKNLHILENNQSQSNSTTKNSKNNFKKENSITNYNILTSEEKKGVLRTKVLSNLNFGLEFIKPNV